MSSQDRPVRPARSAARTVDRRRFLQIAGGTAAASLLPASIARAAEIPAARRTGTIRDVEHVVVLMQENRSFDHYFGTMRGVRGYGDPRPVLLPGGQPVWYQPDADGQAVLPYRPDDEGLGLRFLEGTPHDWDSGHQAFHGGAYDGWIPAKGDATMAHLTRDDIPFHHALADAFTICDGYHCSVLGPTDTNRYYLFSGWTGNDGRGAGPELTNSELGYGWTTYPERLQRAGVSWKVYQDTGTGLDGTGSDGWGWTDDAYIGNYGDNSLLYFDAYRNAKPGDPLYERARTGTTAAKGESYFTRLEADVRANRLPQVSWIAAPEAFCEHPNWPPNYGAWYVAKVLDALTSNPDVWSKTVLFLTYDENDGYFDHVVPPYPPASAAQGRSTVDVSVDLFGEHRSPSAPASLAAGPYGLGQRVPMLVVSPWSKGGWVCSETFDHTSILRFLERRFGVREPQVSPWRRAICGDLTATLDFSKHRSHFPGLPPTAAYEPPDHERHPDYPLDAPSDQSVPRQETGTRPARALPYDLAADAVAAHDGTLRLTLAAHGRLGAAFQVRSQHLEGGPWTYTVGAGRSLTPSWAAGTGPYDLYVHGPNGFHRQLSGAHAATDVTVATRHTRRGDVRVTLRNPGRETVRVTVADAYRHGAKETHRLRPGASVVHEADLGRSHGWYDLTVTVEGDDAYRRRVAGHAEDGRPSRSDPAFGRS